ncbi:MAG: cytochrome b/b6 domain-containing protein [Candidatus Kariarchaeaceae archaeon]
MSKVSEAKTIEETKVTEVKEIPDEKRLEYVKTDDDQKFIIAKRYSLLQRVQHWGNAIAMMLFFITGMMIFLDAFPMLSYQTTQDFHVYLGVFIMFWSLVLYLNVTASEKKFKDIIPTPRDFLDLFTILMCGLGIWADERYPHYDFYDPKKKKYIMKYHPTQKLLAMMNLFMLILIGATGFVLFEDIAPGDFELFASIGAVIVNPIVNITNTNVRFVHFVAFVYFLCATLIHTYFTILKSNRGRFAGMLMGDEKIPVHDH